MASTCPTVETERLILRPFRETDLDDYTALMQTPEVRASLHLPDDVGREHAWNGMAAWLGQWELRGTGQWAAVEKATIEYVFAQHDVNEVFSLILEENERSQAVARRLGFELFEMRFTSHFPSAPHGIWRLARPPAR